MKDDFKETIEQHLGERVERIYLLAETAPSRIYLIHAHHQYIVKEDKKKDMQKEYSHHEAIYECWFPRRDQWGFRIPKPYMLSEDRHFFIMEYIEGENLLQILLRGIGDVNNLFRQTGRCLRQFHDMATDGLFNQTKPLQDCDSIKKLILGSQKRLLEICRETFAESTYRAIYKDFTPSNVVITQTGQVYFLDYHYFGYHAPFYYDLARFIDTTRVFGLLHGLPSSIIGFHRVREVIESFIEGYGDEVEPSLLRHMQIVHRKEHVRMKLDYSLWRGILLWLTYGMV